MQPTMYFPASTKPSLYTPIPKHESNFVKTHINSPIGFNPGSPRANFQLYKIQQRPSSHNLSHNNKHFSPYIQHQSKSFLTQNNLRHNHTYTQKATTLQNSRNRYGQMKISYMGPDSREAAHIKQIKQPYNQNFRTPKKIPRASQPNIFIQTDSNETIKPTDDNLQENAFTKRKGEENANQKQTSLNYISSAKKLDPVDRIRMRKSSFDPTQTWIKPVIKKKIERKWNLNDFEKINQLGTGKYGKVFLVKQKTTQFVCALKIIQKQMLKQQQITEQFIRELKIQLFLNHPNIIKMYGYFDDAVNIYIILEVALGGQLFKQLKKSQSMQQPKIAMIMRQIVAAIHELHSNNIIHRDIKPENIVLNQNIVKLCDFGWSVYHGQTLRNTFCGTPLYVSPQILRGNNYDEKIDIWSLGIMMYEMLTGQNPFKITQQQQLIKIIKDAVTFPSYANISNEAKDFVMCCLQKNPNDRKNIRQLMNHQFFKKYPEKVPDRKMGV